MSSNLKMGFSPDGLSEAFAGVKDELTKVRFAADNVRHAVGVAPEGSERFDQGLLICSRNMLPAHRIKLLKLKIKRQWLR